MIIKFFPKYIFRALLKKLQKIYFLIFKKQLLAIPKLIELFENLNYVILKTDVPYMPATFPISYPLGKDLDILISREDVEFLTPIIEKLKKISSWKFGLKIIRSNTGVKFRFMWLGILHYQIDCVFDLKLNGLEESLLKNRIRKETYWIPPLSLEMLYRASEYSHNTLKYYHLDFIREHSIDWDISSAKRYGIIFPENIK